LSASSDRFSRPLSNEHFLGGFIGQPSILSPSTKGTIKGWKVAGDVEMFSFIYLFANISHKLFLGNEKKSKSSGLFDGCMVLQFNFFFYIDLFNSTSMIMIHACAK